MKSVVEEQESLTHFSTFALAANNGSVIWHHLPGDFGQQKHEIKVALKKNSLDLPTTLIRLIYVLSFISHKNKYNRLQLLSTVIVMINLLIFSPVYHYYDYQ